MPRTILILQPKCFYSPLDEDAFFEWIYALPGFITIVGKPEGLYLTIRSFPKDVILELISIMKRYSMNIKCLAPLCNSNNEKWFKDKEMPWYKAIFGNQQKMQNRI